MRQARDGREILALDGKTYTLDPSIAVIADSKGVHGIGGIMGGEETGVREDTTEVFLEVAYFDADRHRRHRAASSASCPTRATASSAASIRESCRWGAEVATRLILELCGGEASEIVSQRRHARLAAQLHAARRPGEDADRRSTCRRRRPPTS